MAVNTKDKYYKFNHKYGSLDGSTFIEHKWVWRNKEEYKKRFKKGINAKSITIGEHIHIRTTITEGYSPLSKEEYLIRFNNDYNSIELF